jgi:hypothetical protein
MSATVSQVRSGSPGKGIDRVSNQPLKKSGAVNSGTSQRKKPGGSSLAA